MINDNTNISKHLGKTSEYKSTYDSTLLVAEPRQSNRTYLGIQNNALPFVGFDTWNAYECSFLLTNGCPVTGVVKLSYPASSEFIVESKSIKLYLNSYNMQKMGSSLRESIDNFSKSVSGDLCRLLKTDVQVAFIPVHLYDTTDVSAHNYYSKDQYINLENSIDEKILYSNAFSIYKETPSLLTGSTDIVNDIAKEQYLHSGLLKSNCRVTSQPDWGDIYIYIKSCHVIDNIQLLKYIVSFRDECHFHEEICECVYKRLSDIFKPEELFVMCLYARRGGIDINPVRANNNTVLYKHSANLLDVFTPHVKTSKQ